MTTAPITALEMQHLLDLPEGLIELHHFTIIPRSEPKDLATVYGYELTDEANAYKHMMLVYYFRGFPPEFFTCGLIDFMEERVKEIFAVTGRPALYVSALPPVAAASRNVAQEMKPVIKRQEEWISLGYLDPRFATLGFPKGKGNAIEQTSKIVYSSTMEIQNAFFHLWPDCVAAIQAE